MLPADRFVATVGDIADTPYSSCLWMILAVSFWSLLMTPRLLDTKGCAGARVLMQTLHVPRPAVGDGRPWNVPSTVHPLSLMALTLWSDALQLMRMFSQLPRHSARARLRSTEVALGHSVRYDIRGPQHSVLYLI